MDKVAMERFLEVTQAQELKVYDFDEEKLKDCVSFSLNDLVALGAAFKALSSAVCSVVSGSDVTEGLYEAVMPVAGEFAKNHGAAVAGIVKDNAVLGKTVLKTVRSASSGSMFMALTILANNKIMKDISKTQREILGFLEMDKQSQLRGDLIILSDIISDYQHNWDNEGYSNNREMQIIDIKRNAEHNILFYRSMIEKRIQSQPALHMDTANLISFIRTEFKYYKLSVYLYAFASFLDVLLIGNFESSYLNSVVYKIERYAQDYELFYKRCVHEAENYASNSIKSRALKSVARMGKFVGRQLSKIPELEDMIKLDDKLVTGSEKVEEYNNKSIDKAIAQFDFVDDCGINVFADKIRLFDKIHNTQLHIVFSNDRIYLPFEKADAESENV